MAGSGFNRLDTVYFDRAIDELREGSKLFGNAKEAIDKKTKVLIGCWEGKGGNKFKDSYGRLKRELDDEHETLEDMIQELELSYQSYAEWDAKMSSSISPGTSGSGTATQAQPTGKGGNFGGGAGGGGTR